MNKIMDYQSVFHLLSAISKKTSIPFILIGGFAINYYKYSRQTFDVDFLIKSKDFPKILDSLVAAGYKEDYKQEAFARLTSSKSPLFMDIDFMFVDKETFTKIAKDSQKTSIAGCEFRVPSLEHLIVLKLHAIKYNPNLRMAKDMPDIINLIKINKVDAKSNKFKELCLKYATEEIYQKLLEGI